MLLSARRSVLAGAQCHHCFAGQQLRSFPSCPRVPAGPAALLVEAKEVTRRERRRIKHASVRRKVVGVEGRPRLAVFRSNLHIYAQVIDDTTHNTLVSASTLQKDIKEGLSSNNGGTKDAAVLVGKKIAEKCKEKSIDKVCFDRGGFIYHGRVQALADAAREGGLVF